MRGCAVPTKYNAIALTPALSRERERELPRAGEGAGEGAGISGKKAFQPKQMLLKQLLNS